MHGATEMTELVVSFTDLDAERVEVDGGTWFAVGLDANRLDQLARTGPDPAVAARLVRDQRDAVVVLITSADGRAVSVAAWRGMFAGCDLFWAVLDSGAVVVSDHFRNVVSFLPLKSRVPTDEALIEHYLAGWVYDRRTYSAGVDRLAVGDRMYVDLRSGETSIELFDHVAVTCDEDALLSVVDRVEAALDEVMTPLQHAPGVCVTFSGGVDSTLLASFLDDRPSLVAMTTDSEEFDGETAYARTAAGLLNDELTELRVHERDYLWLLEDTIDRMAVPPSQYYVPMFSEVYKRSETTFILGDGADSIFGTGRGMQRVAGAMAFGTGRATLKLLTKVPGLIGGRAAQIHGYADRFSEEPWSTDGEAGRTLVYGDTSAVESVVGTAEVDRLLALHLQAVHERVDLEVPNSNRFQRHVELIHWRNTFADLSTVHRHLAQSNGKRVVMPFTSARVMAELLRVPAEQRYIKGLTGKWVLKEILAKRLPEYPVNQRKHATGLPFERYYNDGPLADIWERYGVPDFILPVIRDEVVASPTAVTWNAITHAIWSDRIERNADLQPLPAAIEYRESLRDHSSRS
jgi:hypothetical protein